VGDVAPVAGDNLVFPPGVGKLVSTNDYPPGIVFGSISVTGGNYQFPDNPIQSTTVTVQGSAVLSATSIVCDTLTIGSLPGVLCFAPADATKDVATLGADVPQSVASPPFDR
jgi:hypothetical protein